MKRVHIFVTFLFSVVYVVADFRSAAAQQPPAKEQQPPQKGAAKGKGKQAAYQLSAEEKQQLQSKLEELKNKIRFLDLRASQPDDRLTDLRVHVVAVERLFEFPEDIFTKADAARAQTVLERGLERAELLRAGKTAEPTGRMAFGYQSALDGSVQPYLLSIPKSYDGTRPVPLYIWLHGAAPSSPNRALSPARGRRPEGDHGRRGPGPVATRSIRSRQ